MVLQSQLIVASEVPIERRCSHVTTEHGYDGILSVEGSVSFQSTRRKPYAIDCDDTSRMPCKAWTNLLGPPISQEYPLNLSILLGGGKETNKDSLSNGE